MKTLSAALSSLLLLGSRVRNVEGCASNAECVCNDNNRCAESVDESIVAFPDEQCRANQDEQCICNTDNLCELLCMDFEALTAEQIIENVRDPNGFIEVRNIASSQHACFDFFTNGHVMGTSSVTNNPLIPDEGVIMGTGKPRDFCWDDSRATSFEFNTPGDADLETLPGIPNGKTEDACFIEFEFRCTGEFPQISFNYVWGSDEYNENIGGDGDDIFAFFLDDVNMAVLPDGATPVTIDNINPSRNSEFYINNREESLHPIIEADGFTTILRATGDVTSGEWKTLKFVIADFGDPEVDSYVLINSLTCVDPSASFTPSVSPSLAPSVSSAPSVSQKPSLSTKPSASAAPSISSKPSVSTAPSISQKPSVSAAPTISSGPSISANPTVSVAPTVSARPSISAAPSISANPTVSVAPTVSARPSISAAPSISANPSISTAPSVSANPSVTGRPTVSTKPSVSAAPTISAKPSISREPSVSQTPSASAAPSVSANPSNTVPTPPIPPIVNGTIFDDLNQNGIRDSNENGLPNIVIGLWCARNGQPSAMVDTDTTGPSGVYSFSVGQPGRCFVRVETEGFLYGPRVDGENQIGPDGRSPEVDVESNGVIEINGGLFLPFEETCVEHCNVRDEHFDCGWGIWNPCTCQCDCDPGFCLSANQKCYDGCLTLLDFNPFGGCRPGTDCPWYPDNLGAAHCTSSQNFAGIYNLHETAEKCCEEHFSSQNVNACAQNSVADVEAQEQLTQDRLDRPRFYWPDVHGKENCVFDSGYDVFMEGQENVYLFDNEVGCCGKWYPLKADCPEVTSATTPFQLDYNPDVSLQFYYPNLSESNCRFGRNYPMWMKNSPRSYLYTTPEECCSVWYETGPSCVQAEDDGVQEGFYWIVDEAFYPNFNGDWCAQGNSYPEWMSDVTERDTHLFRTGQECCDLWFPDETAECQSNIVTVIDGRQIAGPDVTGTWYPSLNGLFVCIPGTPPRWMTASEGFRNAYVFDSRSECCKAHFCQAQRDQTPPF